TYGQDLLCTVAAAHVPDLAGFLFANHMAQVSCAPARVDRAYFRADLAKHGLFRGNGHVAQGGQDIAAANGVTLHAGDHGLGHVTNGAVKLFHRDTDGAPAVVLAGMSRLIAAGAESTVTRPGEHNGGDSLVPACFHECLQQFLDGLAAKRIHHFGAVDRDVGHRVEFFVEDVLEFYGFSFWSVISMPHVFRPCPGVYPIML